MLYILKHNKYPQHIKVGYTNNYSQRLAGYNSHLPINDCEYLMVVDSDDESSMLEYLNQYYQPTKSEWFPVEALEDAKEYLSQYAEVDIKSRGELLSNWFSKHPEGSVVNYDDYCNDMDNPFTKVTFIQKVKESGYSLPMKPVEEVDAKTRISEATITKRTGLDKYLKLCKQYNEKPKFSRYSILYPNGYSEMQFHRLVKERNLC